MVALISSQLYLLTSGLGSRVDRWGVRWHSPRGLSSLRVKL